MIRNRELAVDDMETLLDMVFGDFAVSYGDAGINFTAGWPKINGRYYNKLKRLIVEYQDELEAENLEESLEELEK